MGKRIVDLEDEIKERDRRVAELKAELEDERDLTHRLGEQVEDWNHLIEDWKQAFEMVLGADGLWTWGEDSGWVSGREYGEKYIALVRKWNAFVSDYNSMIKPRNVGRPLAASETQCAHVKTLRKAGTSLREIAEETSLSLATVRTIVAQANGTDRTSIKHLSRIDPDRARMKIWTAKVQMRDRLPKRIHELQTAGGKLIREVKGLGKHAMKR